ncbi:MAG: FAD-dependent oxidoreductase [Streptosporangiales bacterium]|nr:FAD-dependent oxidoreductase [Streptosporangiales bacterium]
MLRDESRRVAVVGAGVSGLTAAYLLSRSGRDVTLLEADDRLGGHAHTHTVTSGAGHRVPVDTGFIVFNERTYPTLTRLFAELGVSSQPSEMSMSVRCAGCGLGYAGKRGAAGVLAGFRPGGRRYARLLAEIPRFHRRARSLLAAGDHERPTLGEFLADGGFSSYFRGHFALPLVAAVWSCPPETALRYPARYLFAFLANHGMLTISGSPPWRTVTGGSRSYVDRIAKQVPVVRPSAPVRAVRRFPGGAEVSVAGGGAAVFDAVVIATHADQALRLLADPTGAERAVLGAFGYTPNPAVLHTDSRLLPRSGPVRASWNYQLTACDAAGTGTGISYHMNRLQDLDADEDYIVTLGGGLAPAPDRVIATMDYAHPAYTPESVAARRRLPELTSPVTAYAGSYHGWGFHEDGCRSGVEAARALGASW